MPDPDFARRMTLQFGRNLEAARLRAGLTQHEAAARAGIAADSLGLIERGETDPDLCTVVTLAHVVQCPLATLLPRVGP